MFAIVPCNASPEKQSYRKVTRTINMYIIKAIVSKKNYENKEN